MATAAGLPETVARRQQVEDRSALHKWLGSGPTPQAPAMKTKMVTDFWQFEEEAGGAGALPRDLKVFQASAKLSALASPAIMEIDPPALSQLVDLPESGTWSVLAVGR